MDIKEFIAQEHLDNFRTDDFEYDIKESFGHNNVLSIDSSSSDRRKVVVKYNGKTHTLVYSRSVFTGSIPFYYTLISY